jgi:hypothetical protein
METSKLQDFRALKRSNWRASFAEEIDKLIAEEEAKVDDIAGSSK